MSRDSYATQWHVNECLCTKCLISLQLNLALQLAETALEMHVASVNSIKHNHIHLPQGLESVKWRLA